MGAAALLLANACVLVAADWNHDANSHAVPIQRPQAWHLSSSFVCSSSRAQGSHARLKSRRSSNPSAPVGLGSTDPDLASLPVELAIPQLFLEHKDMVYGIGLRLCRDPDCAEDLVQETFMRACQGWEGFEGRSRPSTWLYSIAIRANRRLQRCRSGEPRRMECICKAECVHCGGRGDEPYDEAERIEKAKHVRQAVDRLPIRYRLPIVMSVFGGLPARDIAALLNVRKGTLRSRLHRARLLLAVSIQETPASAANRDGSDGHLESGPSRGDWTRSAGRRSRAEELCSGCRPTFVTTEAAEGFCQEFMSEWLPVADRKRLLDLLAEQDGSA